MSYVVLARKYRPQTFEDVVGQNPVSQTLLNALESGRVAHAYIFSGPRGVGKTTTARILAKCLNCVKGPTKMPCNECDACRSISENTSVDDVLEIDGASNRGIEQIRELRESAKYTPARSRYRIYIIDEAHQITKDAFGALLKTLEEPPAHVVFMMATTEVQKIPAPILSRCQRFSLRPISPELVFKHLQEICKKEKINVDDAALADIVRFVEGSLRDALSLLDQAIVFAPEGITSSTVRDLLGLLPADVIRTFANDIHAGDPATILKNVNQSVQDGIDLTQLGKDLQAYYHRLLLAKAGVEDPFESASAQLTSDAKAFDFATLERNIRLLGRALDDMRRSETPRAIFEVYALRLGQKTLDPRSLIERLEKMERIPSPLRGEGSVRDVRATPQAPHPNPLPSGERETPSNGIDTEKKADVVVETPAVAVAEEPTPATTGSIEAGWRDFITDIAALKQSLASALEAALLAVVNGRVMLTFDRSFNQDLVDRSTEILRTPFLKRFGRPLMMDTRLEKAPAKSPAAESLAAAGRAPAARPEPLDSGFEEVPASELTPDVQTALKHFPGAVKRPRTT